MKERFKLWMQQKIGIDERLSNTDATARMLELRNSRLSKELKEARRDYAILKDDIINRVLKDTEELINTSEALMKHFNIAADVRLSDGRSWMVMCVEGKYTKVYFRDMSNTELQHVYAFMNQFKRTNRSLDVPPNMYFTDGISGR